MTSDFEGDFEKVQFPETRMTPESFFLRSEKTAEISLLLKMQFSSTRHKLIYHGASLRFIRKTYSLRLNASYRYKTEVEEILEKLKQEVRIQQASFHKALRKYQK